MRAGEETTSGHKADIERPSSTVDGDPEDRVLRGLPEAFPKVVSGVDRISHGRIRARVERDSLFTVCKHLRDSLGFDHATMITAVDYEDRFELVYHLYSYPFCLSMELITTTPKDDPRVDSVTPLWGGANWQERESYDLMGIVFENHPKLERILLPKEYRYHPLRKDFKG
jgi:NADH-quinone oxidoreductase subunit C